MMKIDKNLIVSFASDAETVTNYEKFVEYFEAYKNKETSIHGVSMDQAHKDALNFFNTEVEKLSGRKMSDWKNNLRQYAAFADVAQTAFAIIGVLTDLIIPNTLLKQVDPIAQMHNVGWGDTLKIELKPRDIFLPSKIGRGKRMGNIRRMYDGEVTIPTYLREVTVGIDYYDILTGKYTLAEYIAKAAAGMETQIRYDIWDAFGIAVAALDSVGDTKLVYTGYAQDDLVGLGQKISAWNNSPAVILGTKIACSKILPATTNYRLDLDTSDYLKNGSLRDFFGFPVIQMEQIANYTTEFTLKLDDTKLYVVSPATQKIMHVAIEGGTLSTVREAQDSAHLLATGTLMKSWGVATATSAIAGVMTVS